MSFLLISGGNKISRLHESMLVQRVVDLLTESCRAFSFQDSRYDMTVSRLGSLLVRLAWVPSTRRTTKDMDARKTPPSMAVAAHIA